MSTTKPSHLIQELRSISNKINEDALNRKIELLNSLMVQRNFSSKDLINYHDTLLFLLAYPQHKNSYQTTQNAISVFEKQLLSQLKKYKTKALNELMGSGLRGTFLISSFGYDLSKYLVQYFQNQMIIDTIDWECENGIEILKLILPKSEQDILLLKEDSITNWFIQLAGSKEKALSFLITCLDEKFTDAETREYFFLKLKVYVKLNFTGSLAARTDLLIAPKSIFFHDKGLIRNIQLQDELKQKVMGPLKLDASSKLNWWRTSQMMLLSLGRETDPLAYGETNAVEVYDAGRGLQVCLNGMRPDKRLPFESYIGYMAYKNGRPIAYGGAWIFGNRARIGLNVFEPYRGGESTWIFAAILRTYISAFSIEHLLVDPYQIGKDNDEAIESGAFWFYYKLGFRPLQSDLKALAASQFESLSKTSSNKTPKAILRKLANSTMGIHLSENPMHIEPMLIAEMISKRIATEFMGNRKKAFEQSLKELRKLLDIKPGKPLPAAISEMAVWLVPIIKNTHLRNSQKTALLNLLLEKTSGNEFVYIKSLQKFSFLMKA